MKIVISDIEYNAIHIKDLDLINSVSLLNLNKIETDGVERALNSLIYLTEIPVDILDELSIKWIVNLYDRLTDIKDINVNDNIIITRRIYKELKSVISETNFDWILQIPKIFDKEDEIKNFGELLPFLIAIMNEFSEDLSDELKTFKENYDNNR